LAAVGDERGASHERREIRSQEQDNIGNFLRLSQSSHRDCFIELIGKPRQLQRRREQRRGDSAWTNAIGANAGTRVLNGDDARQIDDARLRGVVSRDAVIGA
jgi:hypothetical protein